MTSRLSGVLNHLHDDLKNAGPSDGQLLERYLARRDETAFAAIVRRHGPRVFGVCRRVLKNAHDAEDAFQATFLVLVTKAASVRPRELVGHWLYGVAYRTALKAKSLAARRSAKERTMAPQETHHDEPPADWLPLLDEELHRLPEKYRLPLVLCDLDGKTRKQAARQLGWPDGTLSTRLTRARVLLAQRLTRRGVALVGGAAALTLGSAASAQVPAALAASTVRAATGFAAGHAAAAVSADVAALTQGVLKAMLLTKLKTVLAAALVLALVALGVGVGTYCGAAAGPDEPPKQTDVEPAPAVAKPPRVADPEVNGFKVGGDFPFLNSLEYQIPIKADDTIYAAPFVDSGTVEGAEPAPAAAKLPLSPMPAPALVRLTRTGTVAVTTRSAIYQPRTTVNAKGQQVTSYHVIDQTTTEHYSRDDVRVYDTAGRRVAAQDLPRLLKDEVTALIYFGTEKPDPLYLKLFKDGTLFLALRPSPPPPPAVTVGEAVERRPPAVEPAPAPTVEPPLPAPFQFTTGLEALPDLSKEQLKLLKELQGEWRVVAHADDGKRADAEALKDFRMTIHNNQIQLNCGPNHTRGVPPRLRLAVGAGPSANTFDVESVDEGVRTLGIYKRDGDVLAVCLAHPGEKRPVDFKGDNGSKCMVTVYKRVSPAPR
jgi:RNA polymerase sigma factor (sigma-70 family)